VSAKPERSAGIIVFKGASSERQYLLILDSKHGNWGFPKGHIEAGEDDLAAACREVQEEVGLSGLLPFQGFRRELQYQLPGGQNKVAVYFLAGILHDQSQEQQVSIQTSEITEFRWLSFEGALELLSFGQAKDLLCSARDYLK
jgi:bis(5'-nucleosidyl)-tetraphosphatase